jgi:L,D-peptidoglycan transpeptidase YkuD (ErfK/YbiS/YcfS/YnhG family)
MHIKLNNEESSRRPCRAKQEVLRILSVSVAVAMQQAKGMRRIIQTGSFIFFHIIS